MANLVVSNLGEVLLAERMIRTPWIGGTNFKLRLFQNNYTPDKNVTLANVVEATFGLYAPKDLIPSHWQPFVTVAGQAQSFYEAAPQSFAASGGPQVIYGYYVTDDPQTMLIWVQRFDSPQTAAGGSPVLVLPGFSLHSESEP